jgi:hypothetical protein
MKTIINSLSTFLVTILIFTACIKTKNDCVGAICTQEVKMITAKITDLTGANYTFDQIQLIESNGSLIIKTIPFANKNADNSFNIFTDADMSKIASTTTPLSVDLLVVKGSTIMNTTKYVFAKDCCHISKTSGADVVIVN